MYPKNVNKKGYEISLESALLFLGHGFAPPPDEFEKSTPLHRPHSKESAITTTACSYSSRGRALYADHPFGYNRKGNQENSCIILLFFF